MPSTPLNQWCHLVGLYDRENNRIAIYRNGILLKDSLGAITGLITSTKAFKVGNIVSSGGNRKAFKGVIDDIRIYNRALTEAEIQALYHESPAIPTLTEWGLIIFGVVLIGFITYVFLRRRKAVISEQ